MTAAARWLARAVLAAVLVLAVFASLLWVAYGPQGLWTTAWLVLLAVVVTGAVLAWVALEPRHERDGR